MSIWSQASELARNTPEDRNRYIDFLRAASILFVISGHWLIATGFFNQETGEMTPMTVLDIIPETQWLTWIFQVMPIFFIVGGYSNAVSLESARRKNINYSTWLVSRLHRLLSPMLLLVLFWAILSFALRASGLEKQTVEFASQAALVPTWFLAIYAMIVILAPLTYAFWKKLGYLSLCIYIGLAIVVDLAFFKLGWEWLGWSNYFWIWLAAHHLGIAWRDNRVPSAPIMFVIGLVSFAVFASLIVLGPYPLAMAGSPEADTISNTLPPKITLIALGIAQFGFLLSVQRFGRKLLANHAIWTTTVIINTMIMTIYLWHMTILVLLLGLSFLLGGVGMTMEPGASEWWWTRPLWLLALTAPLIPVALSLSPMERLGRSDDEPIPPAWRLVSGAILVGGGLVIATLFGFEGSLSLLNTASILLILGGAALCGLRPKLPTKS